MQRRAAGAECMDVNTTEPLFDEEKSYFENALANYF